VDLLFPVIAHFHGRKGLRNSFLHFVSCSYFLYKFKKIEKLFSNLVSRFCTQPYRSYRPKSTISFLNPYPAKVENMVSS